MHVVKVTPSIKVFCPTGEGGGVDPTCSPGGSGGVGTAAFKEWFGKSKIVDEAGNPLEVYHGTQSPDFEEFDPKLIGSNMGRKVKDEGFWFVDKMSVAEEFAVWNPDKPRGQVFYSYLKMEKPYIWDKNKELQGAAVRNAIKGKYDGVIFPNVWDGMGEQHTQYLVFRPNQVKVTRKRVVKVIPSIKVFCPTGEGGGIDPTCSPGGDLPGGGTPRGMSDDVISDPHAQENVSIVPGVRKMPWEGMSRKEYEALEVVYHGGPRTEGAMFVTNDRNLASAHGKVKSYRVLAGAKIYPDPEIEGEQDRTLSGRQSLDIASGVIHSDDLVPNIRYENWKQQPKKTPSIKVFCPTGEGGGVDPTCSPGGDGEDSKPFKLTGAFQDPDASTHHYHATNLERAHDIASSGLKPHGPSYGTDQSEWPDGSRQKRSYFGTPANVWQFAPEEGFPVALRINRSAAKFKRESTGDVYVTDSVPASKIQVKLNKGWVPITDLLKKNRLAA